jgi:phosphopentomutase
MRALLIVLDSVGCGAAPDAAKYGDTGADTLGHIYSRTPGFALPRLEALGLSRILPSFKRAARVPSATGSWGRMRPRAAGKDTTTGHWELAGAVLTEPFATFERFPEELIRAIEAEAGVQFIGGYPASGTTIIAELGEEHVNTGRPILYTSADSVLQIAAHEITFSLEKLYGLCAIARRHADAYRIGRVIARPFVGQPGSFRRTAGRHDYAMLPPWTVLNALTDAGHAVQGIGKISDIFAGSGISASTPTPDNAAGMAAILEQWDAMHDDGGLLFANLVDFDMHFGHRRDVSGYAAALRVFDAWLPALLEKVALGDLVLITADHGNDPTHPGTDHTREEVPILALHGDHATPLGIRDTFADVAATLADYFCLPAWPTGRSFLP